MCCGRGRRSTVSDQQNPYDPYHDPYRPNNPYPAYSNGGDDAATTGYPPHEESFGTYGPRSGDPGYSGFGARSAPSAPGGNSAGTNGTYGTYGTYGGYGTHGPTSGGYVPGGYVPGRYVPGGQPAPPSGGTYGGNSGEGWQYAPTSPSYGPTYQAGRSQPAPQSWGGYGPGPQSGWIAPGMGSAPAQPQRMARRKLWMTLGIVAALLLVALGGGGYLAYQTLSPAGAVGAFCGSLKSQQYADAYNHFSSGFHQRVAAHDFERAAASLDRIEGRVSRCDTSGGSGSGFQFGGKTATLSLDLARANGNTLSGTIRLQDEGGWKLDAVDTSIFGANLEALAVANTYCDMLTSQNYGALYPELSAAQRKHLSAKDFTQQQQLHDTVDGTASACTLTGLGTANNDAAASLTVTLIRQKLGQRQDAISLDDESGVWKITEVGQQLQGTDVGGLMVGNRFCADLAHSNYSDAWNVIAGNFKAGETESQVAAIFDGSTSGIKTTGCTLDVSTYKVKGSTATVNAALDAQRLSDGATASLTVTFTYQKTNGNWLLSNMTVPKQ